MTKPKRTLSDKLSITGVSFMLAAPVLYIGTIAYALNTIYSLANSQNMDLPKAEVNSRLDNAELLIRISTNLVVGLILFGAALMIISYLKKRAGK